MKDKALFLIYKSKKELSFSFRSKGGYILLDWTKVEDEKTLKKNLRCIRRTRDPKSYGYSISKHKDKEKWHYTLTNRDGKEILRSRDYASRQRCDEGLATFLAQVKGAKVFTASEKI
ncbi:MAG: DUF1508 domain-containing protein [Cryomorphaceae bacterium]